MAVQQVTPFPGKLPKSFHCADQLERNGEDYWIEELKAAQEVEKHFAKREPTNTQRKIGLFCRTSKN
jgi:hypothetical protein